MINRTPEPDLMNSAAQADAYAATDFSEPHDAFVREFTARFPDFSSGSVLDLGCGTADVIIRFAHAYPYTHITGIDGAQAMLDIAERDIEEAGLTERVRLKKRIMPDNALRGKDYGAVISNSLLHHLKDPYVLWNAAKESTISGAPVFIMDLMRPESAEKAAELVKIHAADAPEILKEDFYCSLLAAYTVDEVREQLDNAGLGLKVESISDRHLIAWGVTQ